MSFGPLQRNCRICAASASSRSTPRRTTKDCAQIVVRHGRGMADRSAASASPGATTAAFAATISRCAIPNSENFERENVARWLKDHIAAGVRIVTQNGLYDWGWLRADLGITMPPSEQLEEIGALATLIDENRFSYSLDSLCAWRGLPGKDTALLEEAVKAAGFKISKKTPLQSYIWQLPAHLVGPYAEADPIATLGLFEDLNPILDQEGTRAPIGWKLICCRWCMRCAGAAFALIRVPPNRRATIACRNATRRSPSCRSSSALTSAWHEIASPKWKARTFDAHGIDYPRTEKGNPSFKAGKTRLDGRTSALVAASDRDRQQVRSTPAAHFSKATS